MRRPRHTGRSEPRAALALLPPEPAEPGVARARGRRRPTRLCGRLCGECWSDSGRASAGEGPSAYQKAGRATTPAMRRPAATPATASLQGTTATTAATATATATATAVSRGQTPRQTRVASPKLTWTQPSRWHVSVAPSQRPGRFRETVVRAPATSQWHGLPCVAPRGALLPERRRQLPQSTPRPHRRPWAGSGRRPVAVGSDPSQRATRRLPDVRPSGALAGPVDPRRGDQHLPEPLWTPDSALGRLKGPPPRLTARGRPQQPRGHLPGPIVRTSPGSQPEIRRESCLGGRPKARGERHPVQRAAKPLPSARLQTLGLLPNSRSSVSGSGGGATPP